MEGLMIKPSQSEYLSNNRTVWLKYKRGSYEKEKNQAADSLDLVLMGAYKGKGKYKDKFSSVLVGVRQEVFKG